MIKRSRSSIQTVQIGRNLARAILKSRPLKGAVVLALVGNLGGGKTTFLQGLAKGLGIKEKITSPTFVIMKRFNLACLPAGNFYHLDCYRIQKSKDILDLGFKKIISGPKNIVAIEWADKIKKILPRKTIWINFKFVDNKTRKIVIR